MRHILREVRNSDKTWVSLALCNCLLANASPRNQVGEWKRMIAQDDEGDYICDIIVKGREVKYIDGGMTEQWLNEWSEWMQSSGRSKYTVTQILLRVGRESKAVSAEREYRMKKRHIA